VLVVIRRPGARERHECRARSSGDRAALPSIPLCCAPRLQTSHGSRRSGARQCRHRLKRSTRRSTACGAQGLSPSSEDRESSGARRPVSCWSGVVRVDARSRAAGS
jgi:hypothetical protein